MHYVILLLLALILIALISKYIIQRDISRAKRLINRFKEKIPSDYGECYQQKFLFTKNEYWELRKLIPFTKANNMEILAKVRLLDLVEPREQYKNNKTLLRKVWAKHVDFVITDSTYNVITIIELDDNSHNRPDRIKRDKFVNNVLRGSGYKVIHTFSITDEVLQAIKYMACAKTGNEK